MPEIEVDKALADKREPKHIASDLSTEAAKMRAEWNTNVNHPRALEANRLADLLEEAASILTRKVK